VKFQNNMIRLPGTKSEDSDRQISMPAAGQPDWPISHQFQADPRGEGSFVLGG
jgi:hypothetical protein